MVAIKVVNNAEQKDPFDMGICEACAFDILREADPESLQPVSRLHSCFYFREHLCLVMDLMGDSLNRLLSRHQMGGTARAPPDSTGSARLTPDAIGEIALRVLQALSFLHANGLAHCDVKPDNICVNGDRLTHVVLVDYGSCVRADGERNSYAQSRCYRAPEMMLGHPWGVRVDLWALGCTLAELYAGQPLFRSSTVEGVLAMQCAVLGPPPEAMVRDSPLRHLYYTQGDESQIYTFVGGQAVILEPRATTLAGVLACNDAGFISFLTALLQPDPALRPTAAEAQAHPWLAQVKARRARNHWAVVRSEARRQAFYAPGGVYARLAAGAIGAD